MSAHDEAERLHGHPMQYAYAGTGAKAPYIGDTESMDDDAVRAAAGVDKWAVIERYNRCPICEQWSPCDVRKERAVAVPSHHAV